MEPEPSIYPRGYPYHWSEVLAATLAPQTVDFKYLSDEVRFCNLSGSKNARVNFERVANVDDGLLLRSLTSLTVPIQADSVSVNVTSGTGKIFIMVLAHDGTILKYKD